MYEEVMIKKRNGSLEKFDKSKIYNAISKANNDMPASQCIKEEVVGLLTEKLCRHVKQKKQKVITVETMQNLVENELMENGFFDLARNYIQYRYQRNLNRAFKERNKSVMELIKGCNHELNEENSNKNPKLISTQRDYMAGEVSKDIALNTLLPKDIVDAHKKGIIWVHDLDYYAQPMFNCCLINLEDMLQNGTVISGVKIDKPHSFRTACTIATQIVTQVASSQFGGQTISLSHLAPFVDVSRQAIYKQVCYEFKDIQCSQEHIDKVVKKRLSKEITDGIQTIQYQLITMSTTNGQAPFVTLFMYLNEVKDETTKNDLALLIEEVLKQRIQGVKNEKGVYITVAFPKLIYVLEEDNITENSKYWYLTELATECTAKRMIPDYISEKVMKEVKEGYCFGSMGCRSFLSVLNNENRGKFYGRFNIGVCTINLVDVALSAKAVMKEHFTFDSLMKEFYKIFDERLELCKRVGVERYNKLLGTLSDVSPIHWQYGAIARLNKGEVIDKYLTKDYATVSLGYGGLYECVKALTGYTHTDPKATKIALDIMQYMYDKCELWKEETNLGFSVYGTPMETTTYKFAQKLKERFGVIEGITDKNYITNSFHVHVTEKINPFDKLKFESQFQKLSSGGCISYIEASNLKDNLVAVQEVVKYIYDNIMYAELNIKSDYCQCCGYDGELVIDDDMTWRCPNCNNKNQDKMNVARRTCGYIGTHFWNYGRTQEIKERFVHLGGDFDG